MPMPVCLLLALMATSVNAFVPVTPVLAARTGVGLRAASSRPVPPRTSPSRLPPWRRRIITDVSCLYFAIARRWRWTAWERVTRTRDAPRLCISPTWRDTGRGARLVYSNPDNLPSTRRLAVRDGRQGPDGADAVRGRHRPVSAVERTRSRCYARAALAVALSAHPH